MDASGERTSGSDARPRVDGKFLEVDGRRFLIKGVAYGTFAPDAQGAQFPPVELGFHAAREVDLLG